MQVQWEKTINSIDIGSISEDIENGLKQMLSLPEFDFIKHHVESKIKQIEEFKSKIKKSPIKEIKVELGKFYKTFNGSIVFCASKPGFPEDTTNRMVVIKGGSKTQLDNINQVMYGGFNLGDCYGVESNGVSLYTIGNKLDKFDLDISEEISVDFF